MEEVKATEGNLSDDYEEGEILDEDTQLEDVSSVEEFSCEFEPDNSGNCIYENCATDPQTEKKLKHTKHHRKKEHKCKEDSVCRKERKGKHCYARIRKDKQLPIPKSKVLDLAPNLFNDKNVPKRLEVTTVIKRNTQKPKQSSPVRVKLDSTRPSNRHEHKDYHEKENRHTNKKHWNSNDKLSKSKKSHHEKHSHSKKKMKDHGKSKHSSSTCYIVGDSYHARDYEKNQISSKTSLLKRLVGSGNTGVKTLKDNEASGICIQSDIVESSRSIETATLELSCDTSVKSDSTVTEPQYSSGEKPSESSKSKITESPQPQAPPKKIEVKWMRSIKEDNDELFLRVEALRSAWVKKFNERKKKGLIQQKKSEYIDDSLVDFVLESDSEENNPIWNDSEPLPAESGDSCKNGLNDVIFSVSDLSGDILKPEDMVIASQDKSMDEPIICEPALQIVTSTNTTDPSLSDSTVFIASSSTLFPATNSTSSELLHLNDRTPHSCLKPLHLSSSPKHLSSSLEMKHHQKDLSRHRHHSHSKTPNDIRIYRNITPRSLRDRRSMSRHISRSDRRSIGKFRKKIKKKIMRESLKTNSIDIEDEKLLREQALLSLKSKVNRLSTSQQVVGGSPKVSSNSSITHVSSIQSETSSLPSQELLKEKKLSESEGAAATSNDNWMDDLDEDILRAQLLSSLTKQVSAQSTKEPTEVINTVTTVPKIPSNFNPVLRSQNIIKVPIKKQDRRRLKSVNKKVWKNKLINTSVRKIKVDDSKMNLRLYNRMNSFVSSEAKVQASSNNQSSIPPAIPQVAKLIISVSDSDSSSDTESSNQLSQEPAVSSSTRAEIEANIDILLRQAKMNTQLEKLVGDGEGHAAPLEEPDGNSVVHEKSQVAADEECKIAQNTMSSPEVNEALQDGKSAKNQGMTSCSSSSSSVVSATPQALKHLPPWQQEEYRRLKKKIAEKEKVLLEKELQVIRAKAPLKESSPARQSESEESSGQLDQNQNKPDSTVPESHEELSTPPSISGLLSQDVSSKSPSEGDKAASALSDQEDRLSTKSSKCQTNYSSDDGSPAGKKNYSSLASCSIMEEINVMNDIVNEFHKGSSEYSDLKTKLARLKKAVRVVESKMALKKKKVLLVKDKIQEKDRAISSRIASVSMTQSPASEKNKAPSRDMELIKLKYKEVSLRAQFLFHDFTTDISNCDENVTKGNKNESQPSGSTVTGLKLKVPDSTVSRKRVVPNESKPAEKPKEAIEPPKKRSFSGKEREREEWDPNTPVCHFDLNGICKDEECKYQHFKTV